MKKLAACLWIIFLFMGYVISALERNDITTSKTITQEQQAEKKEAKPEKLQYKEKIVVIAYRLPADEVELDNIPADVTVISREDIADRGVDSLQELFQQFPSFVVYDQVGNGVESTVDLRGFNEGTTTTVLVDGVKVNEPDDNRVNFDLIPIDQVERIEVFKGSSSPLYGNGSMAGTINIITHKGVGKPKLNLGLAFGSYDHQNYKASAGGRADKFSFYASGVKDKASGFRQNGYYDKNSVFGRIGYSLADTSTISFTYLYNDNEFGNPGALTSNELEIDRKQAPFNRVDSAEKNNNLVSVNYQLALREKIYLSANAFYRSTAIDTLTTGRNAALWGGFLTNSDIITKGTAIQFTYNEQLGQHGNSLALGMEYADNEFGADGSTTSPQGDNPFHISSNFTDQTVKGYFLQDSFNINRRLIFNIGARYDKENFDYSDLFFSANDNSKDFSQWSMKAGTVFKLSDSSSAFVSYSEAFLAPTVIELFAYPLFGSNPQLKPTISQDYEVGFRSSIEDKLTASVTWYRINVKDEIVYVFDYYWGGKNENIGKSLRQGIEFSLSGRVIEGVNAYISYGYVDARIKSGENSENRIPLVAAHKLNAGTKFNITEKLMFFAEGIYIGKQYLSGDDQNTQNPLNAYTIINTRLSYQVSNLELWFKVNNVLNQQYSTRGIFVAGQPYFTPAPGINFSMGINYVFSK